MDKQQSLQEENEWLKAKLATAKQGLESAQDCLCNACGTSYRIIEETLDKIGKE